MKSVCCYFLRIVTFTLGEGGKLKRLGKTLLEKPRKLQDLQSPCPDGVDGYKSREQGQLRRLFIRVNYKLGREFRDAALIPSPWWGGLLRAAAAFESPMFL